MNLTVFFDVPTAVVRGLADGSYERVGGIIRNASDKKIVMWLQEGGSRASQALAQPPLAGISGAASASTMLSAVNLGVSVAGFALVLQQLNLISDRIRSIEAKLERVSQKLDDQVLGRLKAGINACQNAVELQDSSLRIQMAGQALLELHGARQFFTQQVIRSAGKAEAASADYIALAFVALAAEVQTYLQLDEGAKAARTLRQGLLELQPGLTQLMKAVLECSCHYLKPEFTGVINLDLIVWLHNGFRRMQLTPGEQEVLITPCDLFDQLRPQLGSVFSSYESWHGELPQVVVDTSNVPDAWLGPIRQGTDKGKRWELVRKELPAGLNRVVALVEAHDRLSSQVLQLEEMERQGLKPSQLQQQRLLPDGQASAIVLDASLLTESVPG